MSNPLSIGILKLHDDLLLQIFSWNAKLFEDSSQPLPGAPLDNSEQKYKTNALYYVRCASQVCNSWRDLVLRSPSLWSKIVNLGFLGQKTDNWRNEVLRRTGEAPLHLRVQILCDENHEINESMAEFFLSILEYQWSRIRKIEVAFDDSGPVVDKACQLLRRSTATLQFLDIRIGDRPLQHPICDDVGDLFANNATSLRHFHATQLTFHIDSTTWISGLRSLQISHNAEYEAAIKPPPYTVIEVLTAIGQISQLEDLSLCRAFKLETPSSLDTPIHLPHLQHFDLHDTTRSCLAFLTSIVLPRSGLSFALYLSNPDNGEGNYNVGTWSNMGDFIVNYISTYLGIYLASVLELSAGENGITIIQPPSAEHQLPGFRFQILDINWDDFDDFFRHLIGDLSSSRLENVKTFVLDYRIRISRATDELANLINALKSVEILRTKIRSLHTLYEELQESIPSCFPALQILEFKFPDIGAQEGYTKEEAILKFLSWRTDVGLSQIETIILGDISFWRGAIGPVGFLEDLEGLKVAWTERGKDDLQEYVCGSGHPIKLSFYWVKVMTLQQMVYEDTEYYPGLELF